MRFMGVKRRRGNCLILRRGDGKDERSPNFAPPGYQAWPCPISGLLGWYSLGRPVLCAMKRPLSIGTLLLGLAACHTQTKQPATTEATGPPETANTAPTATNSPGTSYQVYRALLPGQADSITLHLVTTQLLADKTGASYFGSYYGADGHPYTLQGQPSAAPDSVALFDTSPEKGAPGTSPTAFWRLRRLPGGGGLAGTLGTQPVRLRRLRPAAGALTFAVRLFADSAAAFPKEPKSPVGYLSLQALVPVGGRAELRQALATSILRDLRGDTLGTLAIGTLPALYQQQRQQFIKDYRADATDLRPAPADTAGVGPYGIGLRYENQLAAYVLCQQGNLLSLGFFRYDYSGGAHGNYGTTAASYDLRTGRRLRYNDIFLPAAQAQLPALLGQAVRPLVGLQPGEPLDQQLLVKQMPMTHNVFLTSGGVEFIYGPYEIASYAQGEIRVFLPLPAVQALLREGLPLPSSAVAKR
ncbi:MAG: DUF3298 domain-containing protein [Hymenobacter sp.]|nr:MAG: DUF3298 domain-containing protein [Hymenobacter sp.]